MKKYFFLIVVLLILFLGPIITHNISSQTEKKTVIDLTILPFNTIEFVYSQTGLTAKNIIIELSGEGAVVNSTYFGYDENNDFIPAGLYSKNGVQYADFVEPIKDKNLSVSLAVVSDTIIVRDATNEIVSGASRQAQAGPWLIKSGIMNLDLMTSYSHWQGKYYRTVLILDGENAEKRSIGVSQTKVSLLDLAQYINKTICTHTCDVVNLDGGPSSSYIMFSEKKGGDGSIQGGEGFRTSQTLPFWWILRK